MFSLLEPNTTELRRPEPPEMIFKFNYKARRGSGSAGEISYTHLIKGEITMGIKRLKEQHCIGDELTCGFEVEVIDGEKLDTQVKSMGIYGLAAHDELSLKTS